MNDRITRALILAATGGDATPQRVELEADHPEPPRYPSGISELNDLCGGGFYRTSLVAGFPKLGKTLLAWRCAVESALAGWRVIYHGGENHPSIFRRHCANIFGKQDPEEWPDSARDRLSMFRFGGATTLEKIHEQLLGLQAIEGNESMLVVLDSINYLAENMADLKGMTYFKALRRICSYAALASDDSDGHMAFLLISEVGRGGGVKGQSPEYLTNGVLLTMKGTGMKHRVELDVTARESPSAALGEFTRWYNRCLFTSQHMKVLEGGRP